MTKKDALNQKDAYFRKLEEYEKLSLEELKELVETKDKTKKVGGIYKLAAVEVYRKKYSQKQFEGFKEAPISEKVEIIDENLDK